MSDKTSDQPSRLSSVAILPWMVALVLFLVLMGSVTMLGLGLTGDPHVPSEPEMAQDEQPASEPEESVIEHPLILIPKVFLLI